MNKEVIPGILTESLDDLKRKVELAKKFAGRISIDVIDGIFADNLTVMPEDMRDLNWGELKLDMQLMVEEPVDYLGEVYQLGVGRVFGHVEKMGGVEEYVMRCEELGIECGFGYDLFTPIEAVEAKYLLKATGVLLMAVRAGFSGQKFDERVVEKIKKIREMGFEGDVVVDGGINDRTLEVALTAGANQFSVTSYIWKEGEESLRYDKLAALLDA